MKTSISLLIKPLRTAKMHIIVYILSLTGSSLIFPVAQILLGMTQKNLVNAIEFNKPSLMNIVYIGSVSIILLVSLINPIAGFYQSRAVHKFMQNLRQYTHEKLILLPMSFFDQIHSGDIMTRVDSDLEAIAGIYEWHFNRFLLGIFYGLGSAFVMVFLSWQLACTIVVLAIVET